MTWALVQPVDDRGQINLGQHFHTGDNRLAFGYAEFQSPSARKAQMAVGSDDTLTVWVNGKQVYDHQDRRGFAHEQDRFDVDLVEGANRVVIACGNDGGGWQFAVQVASPAEYAFLKGPAPGGFNPDAFRAFAMKTTGDAEHGRALFSDVQGLACIKCHTVKGQGGTVGPDLSGVGAQYPREELIHSVLYPSAKIFSGYEPVVVATADGQILTGIIKSDTPEGLVIEDAEAKRITIPADDIDERKTSDVSLMPSGLAEGLSQQDFADVIAFLESLKDTSNVKPAAGAAGGK